MTPGWAIGYIIGCSDRCPLQSPIASTGPDARRTTVKSIWHAGGTGGLHQSTTHGSISQLCLRSASGSVYGKPYILKDGDHGVPPHRVCTRSPKTMAATYCDIPVDVVKM